MDRTKYIVEESDLRRVALPEQTDTYTVISHGFAIDKVREELSKNGFTIKREEFQSSTDGQVARGLVYVESTVDEDMGLMFTWINSYDKSKKFSCAIGGFIYDNKTSLIGSEGTSWIRVHTGTALEEAGNVIEQLAEHADNHFGNIILEKNRMKAMPMDIESFGCIMGALYFEKEMLSPTQASEVRQEYKKPTHGYSDMDNLWGLYKLLMFGIASSTVQKWQGSQQKLHHTIMNEYALSQLELDETRTGPNGSNGPDDSGLGDGGSGVIDLGPSVVISQDESGNPTASAKPVMIDLSEAEDAEEVVIEEDLPADVEAVAEEARVELEETPAVILGAESAEEEAEIRKALDEAGIGTTESLRETTKEVSMEVEETEVEIEIEEEEISETISNDTEEELAEKTTPTDPIQDRLSAINGGPGGDDSVSPAERLEELRAELQAECISTDELIELQSLVEHIDPSDVELLEAAGVPEQPSKFICGSCGEPCDEYTHNEDKDVDECPDCVTRERKEWADNELKKSTDGDHVGPPEMYTGDTEVAKTAPELLKEAVIEQEIEMIEEEIEIIEEEEVEVLTDSVMEEVISQVDEPANLFPQDNDHVTVVEYDESASELAPASEEVKEALTKTGEVVEIIDPVMDKVEEIIEAKKPEVTEEVEPEGEAGDSNNTVNDIREPEVEVEDEEEDFLEVEEMGGLTVPTEILAQAEIVENRMVKLYGVIRPYSIEEGVNQLNVTIDESNEAFYVSL